MLECMIKCIGARKEEGTGANSSVFQYRLQASPQSLSTKNEALIHRIAPFLKPHTQYLLVQFLLNYKFMVQEFLCPSTFCDSTQIPYLV